MESVAGRKRSEGGGRKVGERSEHKANGLSKDRGKKKAVACDHWPLPQGRIQALTWRKCPDVEKKVKTKKKKKAESLYLTHTLVTISLRSSNKKVHYPLISDLTFFCPRFIFSSLFFFGCHPCQTVLNCFLWSAIFLS